MGLVHLFDSSRAESLLSRLLLLLTGHAIVVLVTVILLRLLLAREARILLLLNDGELIALTDEARAGVLVLVAEGEVRVVLMCGHVMRVILLHVHCRLPKKRCASHHVRRIEAWIFALGHWMADRELALTSRRVVHPRGRLGSLSPELGLVGALLSSDLLLPTRA